MLKRYPRLLLASLLCLFFNQTNHAIASDRIALVIGNGAYQASSLKNSVNDAQDISAALQDLSFDVTTLTDADQPRMIEAIRDFGQKLGEGVTGLFYYAGHGIQVDGHNYLVPINTDIQSEDEIRFSAIDVGQILAKMEASKNGLNIIMLDACRNNPFKNSFSRAFGSRGLAVAQAPTGSMVVYATAPNTIAGDGGERNGVFTGNLLKHIKKPNVNLEEVIRMTRAGVVAQTNSKQVPWSSSSLTKPFYFSPSSTEDLAVKNAKPDSKLAQQQPANGDNSRQRSQSPKFGDEELTNWFAIRETDDPVKLQLFLQRFPDGMFSNSAQLKINSLKTNNVELYIETIPTGANVRILNITPIYTYGMLLETGNYHIEVSHPKHTTQTIWIALNEEALHIIELEPREAVEKTLEIKQPDADIEAARRRQSEQTLSTNIPILPIDSKTAKKWHKKAVKATKNQNWPEVIRTESLAIEADPQHIDALINRGLAYINLKYFDHADSDIDKVLSLDSTNMIAQNNKGIVWEFKKDLRNAITTYRQSCKTGFQTACENFKRLTGYFPADKSEYYRLKGLNNFNKGEYEQAIDNTTVAINTDKTNHMALILRSAAYTMTNQAQLGFQDATNAIKLNPDDALGYNNLGFSYEKLGSTVDALINYTIACNMGAQLSCQNLQLIKSKGK